MVESTSLTIDSRLFCLTLIALTAPAVFALTVLAVLKAKAGNTKTNTKTLKTFYVQKYNKEGEPLQDEFEPYEMSNNDEFFCFLRRTDAKGLVPIDNSGNEPIITSLERVIPKSYYQLSASHLLAIKRGVFWTKVEDVAIEDETLLAVKGFLFKKFNSPVETFPRTMYKNDQKIMEWDGVVTCNNMTFLLECKHKMTEDQIEKIVNRLDEFTEKVEETDTLEFKKLIGKRCIGVACGSYFPEELRNKSIDEYGLAVAYPSGDRYKVEVSENLISQVTETDGFLLEVTKTD